MFCTSTSRMRCKGRDPALGVRAIQICLNRPEVFKPRLRAAIRKAIAKTCTLEMLEC